MIDIKLRKRPKIIKIKLKNNDSGGHGVYSARYEVGKSDSVHVSDIISDARAHEEVFTTKNFHK